MSTGTPVTTHSWVEAVAVGWFGDGIDTKPADWYTVTGPGGGGQPVGPPRLDGTNPPNAAIDSGPFTVDYLGSGLSKKGLTASIVSSDNVWTESTSTVASGDGKLTASYAAGPGATAAAGLGYTVVKNPDNSMYTGQAAFTWDAAAEAPPE